MSTRQMMNAQHKYVPVAETAAAARAILEKKIEAGRVSAMALFERINTQVPADSVTKGKALNFDVASGQLVVGLGHTSNAGQALTVHPHALRQLSERSGIPLKYLGGLLETGGWKAELAKDILVRHYGLGEGDERFLVRAVAGQMRGFLSSHNRRLDSRPLIDAFAQECQKLGAVPVDGTCSDTRVALKALLPGVYEPVAGEVMAFGLEWSNSDFGHGRHNLRAYCERLWCLNGAVMQDVLAQVHLGRELSEDFELSQRTYELDTSTSISALRDVVAGTLSAGAIEKLCDGIRAADEKEVEWKHVSTKLAKKLLKGELDDARKAFESDDVINLPAGHSAWRASNALSWIAGHAEDPNRKLELQRIAGAVLHGKMDEVEAVAA